MQRWASVEAYIGTAARWPEQFVLVIVILRRPYRRYHTLLVLPGSHACHRIPLLNSGRRNLSNQRSPSIKNESTIMCFYEHIVFACGHSMRRLARHCHFARNDPNHQCFGVAVVVRQWRESVPCPGCG
ncbi:hypothetical protein P152DRAFT_97490 [Eremomyces bilateralis CBS 781.70]|uniref:Uncharacterized protein n=1 Tax=Eremomyces bilateralis CBS 781.70 TaxID=1392243 RepID=A0A6G1FXK4_9PEZI|nr:uncharacterized protein P152DRAFT_97490 [Eremomyces bilateralis CBS 781.70]KAF1810411.1 hypothetical protein P152DRAFT_97490 [Eremomyces bilateralis CBS 781.70]